MSTRTVDGHEIPAAGTWVIDPSHSTIAAVARHLVVSKVRGSFGEFSGTITVGESVSESSVALSIEAASISTGAEDRDGHIRSADFLDVENHPQLAFASTSVAANGDGWTLAGDLTMRGVTKPLSIEFEFLGVFADPWGNNKAAFSGSTRIEREEWGVNWNCLLYTSDAADDYCWG